MNEKIEIYLPPIDGPSAEEIDSARKIINEHEKAIEERNAAALVKCTSQIATGPGCGQLHTIGELEYIQTHYYVSPHGCTGGDYWLPGEGNWVCPTCGHRNRLYASPEVAALKGSFKSTKDTYDKT